ncbi:S1C family serine protease [Anatilimnocola floriformis]|uniref:S1C family serine protease n=1 Tax=Anatilimnocola floriformis TaxID=2948575 RepID=UPI0020C4BB40|nr:trypsin-like peptidase domain-containing protein [Anatilimnocola floriformis]
MKRGIFHSCSLLLVLILVAPVVAESPTLAELKKAQEQTREHLDKMIAATVGIHLEDSSGSGVIVSEDGYILTAAHVIMIPGDIFDVELSDGRRVKAKSLGMDHEWDAGLAKIQVDDKWPHVKMSKEKPKAGEWCLATGHPGGIFKDRKPPLRLGRILVVGDGTDPLAGLQTDATVYPGDSGGPLFNLKGEVIGIHSNIGLDVLENQHVPVEIYQKKWDDFVASKEFGEPYDPDAFEWSSLLDLIPDSIYGLYDVIASWFIDAPDYYGLAKDSAETLASVESLTTPLERSIVDVLADEKAVAVGLAVSRRGQVLTKLSVLKGELHCLVDDEPLTAKIVAKNEAHDLALLQIEDAPRLKPVTFADKAPQPGAWLVTPDIDASPLSLGIVSNAVTKVEPTSPPRGAMKVEVADADDGGVHIKRVIFGGPASKAGIRVDDTLIEFDGKKLADAEALFKQMEKTKPGQEVGVKVKRADKELDVKLQLVLFVDEDEEYSGHLSERRAGFPAVFAHDTAIIPQACGSPVLDLDGKIVGVNIARAGRVTTYAIPAEELQKIVPKLVQQAKRNERKTPQKAPAEKPMPASEQKDKQPANPVPAPMAP